MDLIEALTGVKVEGILRQAADVDDVERRVWEYEQGGPVCMYECLTNFRLMFITKSSCVDLIFGHYVLHERYFSTLDHEYLLPFSDA